jgi:predicted permease
MYAGGLSFAGLVFCGLIPVWKVTHGAAWAALRSGTVEGGRAEYPWSRFILVGSQIALTVVLAFGGAQLARSAAALGRVDLGFDGGVLTVRVPYDRRVHDTNAKRAQLYQRIRDRVRQVPGVVAAGVVTHAPLGGSTMMDGYEADLSTEPSFEQSANYQAVTPGYFDAVNIRIIQGRDFTDQEDASLQNVVIVDETLVRTVFPGATDVLGRTLRLGWGLENAPIVGVVAHARTIDVARAVRPQIYVPIGKLFQAAGTVTVRTNGDPRLLATPIASAIEEAGPGRAIAHIGMLSDNVSAATSALRAVTSLVTFLAGFAAALSALGLYLVIAFVVHERRRATAIRAALGATRAQVVWHHLRTGSVVLAVALPAGLLLSLAAAPIFEDLLHGVDRHDPASLAAAVGAALLAGVTGTYFPAHRAARADVVKALHEQ